MSERQRGALRGSHERLFLGLSTMPASAPRGCCSIVEGIHWGESYAVEKVHAVLGFQGGALAPSTMPTSAPSGCRGIHLAPVADESTTETT